MRRGVRGAGHHAVGDALVHHHGSEIRDVGHDLAGPLDAHALVLANLGVLGRELLGIVRGLGVEHLRPVEVDSEFGCTPADRAFLAEDGQLRHLSLQQATRGAEDSVVAALGEHDVLAVGASTMNELVLEHLRSGDRGNFQFESIEECPGVDALLHQAQGSVDLALRTHRHPPARLRRSRGGVEGAQLGGQDRQPRTQSGDEASNCRMRFDAAVHDDPCQRGKALGLMGVDECQQNIRPIRRHDDDDALGEPFENVLGGHATDHDALGLSLHQFHVTAVELAVDRLEQLGHRRGHEQRDLRQAPSGYTQWFQRSGDLVQGLRITPIGDDSSEVRMIVVQLGQTQLRQLEDLVGSSVRPAQRQKHRCSQARRDARVEAQFARTADIGVVAADDDHRIALRRDVVEARDDLAERGVGIGMHRLVGDTE